MIAYLKGKIQTKGENYVVIVVGGQIGYKVFIPPRKSLWDKVKEGTELEFQCVQTFAENDQRLYGFETLHEKQLFELLLTVSGIGPKHASELLGKADSYGLARAIALQDEAVMTSVSGIGKKTASRILIELKDKVVEKGLFVNGPDENGKSTGIDYSVLLEALQKLGFSRGEADKMISKSEKELVGVTSIEDSLALVLKNK